MQSAIPGLPKRFVLVTLHRPSNVDNNESLCAILEALLQLNEQLDVVFPVHPRTRQRIEQFGINLGRLRMLEPLPYLEFLSLQQRAAMVITDSGGIQEETTYLGVPCLTLRSSTERPVTVTLGTNVLIGNDLGRLGIEVGRILEGKGKKGAIPPLWDGHAAERIVEVLQRGYLPRQVDFAASEG
jgi:UDP-N-acetylglucosamine 2-epimerase (non-hydrolysing)